MRFWMLLPCCISNNLLWEAAWSESSNISGGCDGVGNLELSIFVIVGRNQQGVSGQNLIKRGDITVSNKYLKGVFVSMLEFHIWYVFTLDIWNSPEDLTGDICCTGSSISTKSISKVRVLGEGGLPVNLFLRNTWSNRRTCYRFLDIKAQTYPNLGFHLILV